MCAYDVLAYVAGNACCTEVHRSEFRVVNEFRVVDAQDEFADLGFVRNLGRLAGVGVVFGRYGVSADADFRAKQFVDVVQRHQGLASVERSQQLRILQQRLLADGLLVERHFDGGVVVGDRLLVLGVNAEFDLLGLVGHDAGEVRQHGVRYLRGGFVLGAGSGIHGVLDRKGQRDPFLLFLVKLTKLLRRHGGGYGELTLLDKPNVGDGGCGSCRCGTGFYLLGDNSERRFSVSIGIYEVFGQRGRRDAVGQRDHSVADGGGSDLVEIHRSIGSATANIHGSGNVYQRLDAVDQRSDIGLKLGDGLLEGAEFRSQVALLQVALRRNEADDLPAQCGFGVLYRFGGCRVHVLDPGFVVDVHVFLDEFGGLLAGNFADGGLDVLHGRVVGDGGQDGCDSLILHGSGQLAVFGQLFEDAFLDLAADFGPEVSGFELILDQGLHLRFVLQAFDQILHLCHGLEPEVSDFLFEVGVLDVGCQLLAQFGIGDEFREIDILQFV